jgi:glutathionyl-hydroquinone reductase
MVEGLERVSRLVTEYAIVEALYLSEGYLATDQMTEAIARLYSAILIYFAKAGQFYNKSAFGTYQCNNLRASYQTEPAIKNVLQAA